MKACPQCRRYSRSNMPFAGTEGLCVDCYLADTERSVATKRLFECISGGERPPHDVVYSVAESWEPYWQLAEGYGQMRLWEVAL